MSKNLEVKEMNPNIFLGLRNIPSLNYHRPGTLKECLDLIRTFKSNSKILAGGTDLIPAFRAGRLFMSQEGHLIDVNGVKELDYIREEEGTIKIGALTRLAEVESSQVIRKRVPVLGQAIAQMGSLQIRNLATIGGNLCNASPAADSAIPLLALDSIVKVANSERERLIPLNDFFTGPGKTVLSDDEMLVEIQIPLSNASGSCVFYKLGRRNAFTLSVVSIGVYVEKEGNRVRNARIALGAVAPTPMRAYNGEKYIMSRNLQREVIEETGRIVSEETKPISDVRASAFYRRQMAFILTKKALNCISYS
jgi:carbon-monoxide dehydrogenase medium subunit